MRFPKVFPVHGYCLAAIWLTLLTVFAASPSQAAMNVCNRTSYVLYTAVGTQVNTQVVSQGWTRVVPGACQVVLPGDLVAPAYYLYARSSQAHSGPSRAWGGGTRICVRDTNFTSRDPLAAVDCESDDFFQLPFAAVDTHHLKSWTTTFSESPALATLAQAQRAGLKRLLHDAGYKLGTIDAGPDKAMDAALADFRKRLRLSATASTGDLFDALETEALKSTTPAGYSVCNDTAKAVAAALGQKVRNDWISHGWWKIAAGSCAKVVDSLAGIDAVYLYVQKIGGPALVSGANKFCVADIEFDIQSRTSCAARGLTGYAAHVGETGLVKPMPRRATPPK